MIWTAAFWKGAAERAIKTGAQALAALLAAGSTGLLDVDWGNALSVAGLAIVASVVTSIANPTFVSGDTSEDADAEVDEAETVGGLDGVADEADDTSGKHAADTPAE